MIYYSYYTVSIDCCLTVKCPGINESNIEINYCLYEVDNIPLNN